MFRPFYKVRLGRFRALNVHREAQIKYRCGGSVGFLPTSQFNCVGKSPWLKCRRP